MHEAAPQTSNHGNNKPDPHDALDVLLDLMSTELASQIQQQAASAEAAASEETVRISLSVTVDESPHSW